MTCSAASFDAKNLSTARADSGFVDRIRAAPLNVERMAAEPGYWAVLKHADVVHVAREPKLFSASEGGVMLENLGPEQLDMMRNMLLAMDPPRHVDYRRPIDTFRTTISAVIALHFWSRA